MKSKLQTRTITKDDKPWILQVMKEIQESIIVRDSARGRRKYKLFVKDGIFTAEPLHPKRNNAKS